MQFDQNLLSQVTTDVCSTMLGLPVTDDGDSRERVPNLVAKVCISGEWGATVEVATTHEAARTIAAKMFSMTPSDVQSDDMCDALGEVANMVGGNLKGMANGDLDLSVPKVEARTLPNAADSATTQIRVSCGGGPMVVRLCECV